MAKKQQVYQKWFATYQHIAKYGNPGVCPFCESADTDYFVMFISGNDGFMEVFCNECRKAHSVTTRQMPKDKYNVFTEDDYNSYRKRRNAGLRLSPTEPQSTNFTEQLQPMPQAVNA
ncbi:MAG: hypothetical protein FWG64_07300 [Firmicutes bacterium]|nr:hypothetical protein [Bacillota bacterium]